MPTNKVKNIFYRFALPFLSPSLPSAPIFSVTGHSLIHYNSLSSIIRRNHITGGSIFIQNKSENAFIFSKAIHTDLIPNEKTYYRVASITKMATALLCIQLMDMGILDPTQPVSEILPNGADIPELHNVRITHLLSHTSGIMDPPNLEDLLIRKIPYPEALTGCRICNPGDSFHYSNLAFGLIGCVFESLLNKAVPSVYKEYLFDPLNMNATLEGCTLCEEQIMPVIRMLPYKNGTGIRLTRLGRIPVSEPNPLLHYGHTAGSMYTDLPSLVKMTCCIRDGGITLLSPKYSGYMKKQISSYGSASPTLSYGSGLLIIQDPQISKSVVYGHQGFAYGCVDGAFWEENTGSILISLNGGASEARIGRFGLVNHSLCHWAFEKELPKWK